MVEMELEFCNGFHVQLPAGVTPFTHIVRNDSGRKQIKQKEEDIAICECKFDPENTDSACGDGCLNVLTNTECTPGYCPCGNYCKNQRFQKSEYMKTKLFKTESRGWGLLADEDIKAGQFIIEYCGEVISSEEAEERSLTYETQGLRDAYIISLNANSFIDATRKGSLARFINHSCQPNCETRKWTVLGETRVGIFARQDICVGTELAYDYNFEWYGGANVRCLCGAPNCSVFLGAKSHGFLEHNHVWEDGDDRYTVDEFPLYDSAEDEPSIKHKIINAAIETDPTVTVKDEFVIPETDPTVSKQRATRNSNKKQKLSGRKQVNGKRIAHLFSSKQVQEELIKCEEIRSEATAKLDSVYDEIRPAIEERERDSLDSLPISVAEKWIDASCSKLKADFDLYFAVVKNVVCPSPVKRNYSEGNAVDSSKS